VLRLMKKAKISSQRRYKCQKKYHAGDVSTIAANLFSRQVVGWSMSKRIDTDLALDAATMACWHRNRSKK